jgi:hypothetical protein
MNSFTCPHCGKSHEGDPSDWGWTLPDEVWAIPDGKRSEEAKYNADLCKWGERYFIRCILPIPFSDREGYFGWGVWVEVDQHGFEAYLNIYEVDGSNEPRIPGTLANKVPGYSDLEQCSVELQFGPSDQRPMAYFTGNSSCQMAQEQTQGIDAMRYHQILQSIGVA